MKINIEMLKEELNGWIVLTLIAVLTIGSWLIMWAWENGDEYEMIGKNKGRRYTWLGRLISGLKKLIRL